MSSVHDGDYTSKSHDFVMEIQKQMATRQESVSQGNVSLPHLQQDQEKKQREIYVGNLAQGIVTKDILEEFFNQALSHMVSDPVAYPPVIQVKMEGSGRFAFIELRTQEMAKQAMRMDKLVEIYGRKMNVGRPKGFIEDYQGSLHANDDAVLPKKKKKPSPSEYLLLSNIWPAGELKQKKERTSLKSAVLKEAKVHGNVKEVIVPCPSEDCHDMGPGRAYVHYTTVDDAKKGKDVFHTRTLTNNKIYARYVSGDEFQQAKADIWADRTKTLSGIDLQGLYALSSYSAGLYGLLVVSPTQGALIQNSVGALDVVAAEIQEEEVPFEEGWVKLRGFAAVVSKDDIASFFKSAGNLEHKDINLVYSADGTHLGEAYIYFHGQGVRLRLALAKDRTKITSLEDKKYVQVVEVFTAFESDMERRVFSGCQIR